MMQGRLGPSRRTTVGSCHSQKRRLLGDDFPILRNDRRIRRCQHKVPGAHDRDVVNARVAAAIAIEQVARSVGHAARAGKDCTLEKAAPSLLEYARTFWAEIARLAGSLGSTAKLGSFVIRLEVVWSNPLVVVSGKSCELGRNLTESNVRCSSNSKSGARCLVALSCCRQRSGPGRWSILLPHWSRPVEQHGLFPPKLKCET